MKIYIVCYYLKNCDQMSISSEGYKTLEEAQNFIKSRSDEYTQLNPMQFADDESVMLIKEISVKEV